MRLSFIVLVVTNTTNNTYYTENQSLIRDLQASLKIENLYFVNFVEREVSIETIEDQEKYSGCICIFQE